MLYRLSYRPIIGCFRFGNRIFIGRGLCCQGIFIFLDSAILQVQDHRFGDLVMPALLLPVEYDPEEAEEEEQAGNQITDPPQERCPRPDWLSRDFYYFEPEDFFAQGLAEKGREICEVENVEDKVHDISGDENAV